MPSTSSPSPRRFFIALECGGTKCSVHVSTSQAGVVASAVHGSCNYTTLGLEESLQQIKQATETALARLPDDIRPSNTTLPLKEPIFAGLILGMAGVDRESDVQALTPPLADLFGLDPEDKDKFIVGNDAMLLSIPLMTSKYDFGIALVAGTGSVAYSFSKTDINIPQIVRRAGGYGSLIDDDGSGFHIGKLAIKSALTSYDSHSTPSELSKAIYEHFGCSEDPGRLLQRVYEQESAPFPEKDITSRIASVCQLAFKARKEQLALGGNMEENEADCIMRIGAASLADLLMTLLDNSAETAREACLILGGSLFNDGVYEEMLVQELRSRGGIRFGEIEVVTDAGKVAAEVMAKQLIPSNGTAPV